MSLKIPDLGVEAFYDYYECEPSDDAKCLAELICKWIADDTRNVALRTACGDFQLWLTIVWLIADTWHASRFLREKPTSAEPIISWHITTMLCRDRKCSGREILDPYCFAFFKSNPE